MRLLDGIGASNREFPIDWILSERSPPTALVFEMLPRVFLLSKVPLTPEFTALVEDSELNLLVLESLLSNSSLLLVTEPFLLVNERSGLRVS